MPTLAPIEILAEFQQELVGNWRNLEFGEDAHGGPVGGEENPLSYNIMPLPQTSDPDGYILKNFKFHEKLRFNNDRVATTLTVAARAPNRGGQVNQDARALFYEQQVMFAEGPDNGMVVHVENGAWLWLPRFVQQTGPYPANAPGNEVSNALQQPSDMTVAKQISVPHGNSILALGNFDTVPGPRGAGAWRGTSRIGGSPVIPDNAGPYPAPAVPVPIPDGTPIPPELKSILNADQRYATLRVRSPDDPNDFENPHPDLTQNPNKPLQEAVAIIEPDSFIHWRVTTEPLPGGGRGFVTNIPFERQVSRVSGYFADYWILFRGKNKYLAYTQTILLTLRIPSKETERVKDYVFPHITCNTVTFSG